MLAGQTNGDLPNAGSPTRQPSSAAGTLDNRDRAAVPQGGNEDTSVRDRGGSGHTSVNAGGVATVMDNPSITSEEGESDIHRLSHR